MTIKEYDVVALTKDISSLHLESKEAMTLRRGQVGTVVTAFNGEAFLIDFADNEGQTYAMETVPAQYLMRLLHEPIATAA